MIRIKLSTMLGERRMTQAELARKTGIRQGTINDLYHEFTDRVNLRHLEAICEVLDCNLTDILVEETSKSPVKHPATSKTANKQ